MLGVSSIVFSCSIRGVASSVHDAAFFGFIFTGTTMFRSWQSGISFRFLKASGSNFVYRLRFILYYIWPIYLISANACLFTGLLERDAQCCSVADAAVLRCLHAV